MTMTGELILTYQAIFYYNSIAATVSSDTYFVLPNIAIDNWHVICVPTDII